MHVLTTVTQYRYYRDDIVRAIRTLKPLSGGFEVLHIGSHKMVRSVPKELDKDQAALLLLAQVRRLLCYHYLRLNSCLENMLRERTHDTSRIEMEWYKNKQCFGKFILYGNSNMCLYFFFFE